MTGLPTIEMFKDGKRMICNESDRRLFEAQGWGVEVAKPAPAPDLAPKQVEKPAKTDKKK